MKKFDSIYKFLGEPKENIQANINDTVTESLKKVKESINEALKAENSKLKSKVDSLAAK